MKELTRYWCVAFIILLLPVFSCKTASIGYLFIDDNFKNNSKGCADLYVLPTVNNAAKTKYDNADPALYELLRYNWKGGRVVSPAEILGMAKDKNATAMLEALLKNYATDDRIDQESLAALKEVFGEGYLVLSWVSDIQETAYYSVDTDYLRSNHDLMSYLYWEKKGYETADKDGSDYHKGKKGFTPPVKYKPDHPKIPDYRYRHNPHRPPHYHNYYYDYYRPYYPYPYQPVPVYFMGSAITFVENVTGKKVYEISFKADCGYGPNEERVKRLFSTIESSLPRCGSVP